MPVGDCELPVPDHYRRVDFFLASEREVICSIETLGLPALKHEIQAAQESPDRPLTRKSVPDTLRLLMRKAALYIVLRVGAWHNIDRLHFVLQRLQDIVQELIAIVEKRCNHRSGAGASSY